MQLCTFCFLAAENKPEYWAGKIKAYRRYLMQWYIAARIDDCISAANCNYFNDGCLCIILCHWQPTYCLS